MKDELTKQFEQAIAYDDFHDYRFNEKEGRTQSTHYNKSNVNTVSHVYSRMSSEMSTT